MRWWLLGCKGQRWWLLECLLGGWPPQRAAGTRLLLLWQRRWRRLLLLLRRWRWQLSLLLLLSLTKRDIW